jgi:predicted nucleic acid-binding protein
MAAFVLDCSVALAWFLPAERSAATEALLDQVVEAGAVVPALWRLEVGNVLLMAERQGRISRAHRLAALAALRQLPISIDPETADHAWGAAMELAATHALTLYDAAYLELALRAGLPLATLDRALGQAARAVGLAVLGQ